MIAYSRGSKRLAGAGSPSHRMPAVDRSFTHLSEIAQWVEQQPQKLSVAGSTPVLRPSLLVTALAN